jgi:hypothetical protein
VPPAYYDQYPTYYTYQEPAPPYVIAVPPPEATTSYSGPQPTTVPPDQCYGPKVDANGNILKDNGNMIPDFSKPVPCPPQQ